VSVLAAGAVSALGRGRAAYDIGSEGAEAPSGLQLCPGRWPLRHPLVGAVDDRWLAPGTADRATRLLCAAASDVSEQLDLALPDWRKLRVGLIVGTSSGSMQTLESALSERAEGKALDVELAQNANYWLPLSALEACLGRELSRSDVVEVLAACASSTLALGLACRFLDAERYDLVLAGGYDALSALVASGFNALAAVTRTRPRPFAAARDGMALAEGAALIALARAEPGRRELGRILGFGASADAVHITAPDREGRGLVSAARHAAADAGIEFTAIDFVSPHATATAYNDEAEARALGRLFAPRRPLVQPWKAVIGHALGAAGALEALAAWDALARGLAPAAAPRGTVLDAEVPLRMLECNQSASVERALKLSSAFGGANAALILGAPGVGKTARAGAPRSVALAAAGDFVTGANLEAVMRWAPPPAAERADSLSELVLAAVAALLEAWGEALPERTAVVVGTATATLELDERFESRRRGDGVAEPRRFAATSPNLCAGLTSICFRWRGPSFSVGGPEAAASALRVATQLVADGDAIAAVVISAEDSGPVVADLFRAASFPAVQRGARAALLLPWPRGLPCRPAVSPGAQDPLGRLLEGLAPFGTPI
jgi:3-oxoacyl-[acyl-carrier-protein] synthase II